MQLKDFINYRVEMIQPTDTLQEAAEKMRYLDVGSMPVCEGQTFDRRHHRIEISRSGRPPRAKTPPRPRCVKR